MSNSIVAYSQRPPGISNDLIKEYLQNNYSNDWKGNALDLGCGKGDWSEILFLSKKFQMIECMDLFDGRVGMSKNLKFHSTDLANQKFPVDNEQYDFIFAIEVLEHIENPRHFLREVYRILKPNGRFIMSTPSVDSLRSKISYLLRGYFPPFCEHDYKGSGHISPISSLDFKRMSQEVGFTQLEEDFSLRGRMPMLVLDWQTFFPWLSGKQFSDVFICTAKK